MSRFLLLFWTCSLLLSLGAVVTALLVEAMAR